MGQIMARTNRISPIISVVIVPISINTELITRLACDSYCWPMGQYMHSSTKSSRKQSTIHNCHYFNTAFLSSRGTGFIFTLNLTSYWCGSWRGEPPIGRFDGLLNSSNSVGKMTNLILLIRNLFHNTVWRIQ